MAFSSASGYSNLPNGNFSPVIYSQKVQKTFRKLSVVEDITNTDYFGEISDYGDSVKLIKEPEITVNSYERGTSVAAQDLSDADFTMVINQANYFMFKVDDIESQHSHVNFMDLATDRAAYKIKDKFDQEVLGHLSGFTGAAGSFAERTSLETGSTKANSGAGNDELLAANKLDITDFGGSAIGGDASLTSIPVDATGTVASPLDILNRMARLLDAADVPSDGRWFVADPVFWEILMDEDSKFISNDFAGGQDAGDILRNGTATSSMIRGFRVYKSNNLPYLGTGPGTVATAGSETNFGVLVAGHDSAVATAQQLSKTESYRDTASFADIVRGLQLYGRKILRPESIVTAQYNKYS